MVAVQIMSKPYIRPRVALVALHFAEYATHLAMALAEKMDVLLVLYRDNAQSELGSNWTDRIKHSSLTLLVMERPRSVFLIIRNTRRLVSAIKEFRPDVIHYQENPRDELILGLLLLSAIPTILTIHDPSPHSGVDTRRLRFSRFRLYRPLFRNAADIAITHGNLLANELVKVCPRFKGRVHAVPHGPLGSRVSSEATTRCAGEIRLLFFGRIHEYKGLRYFIDSVIILRNKGYPVIGVVAGRGSDLEPNRQRMEEEGCFEILERYISSEEIPNLFLDSCVVILPYIDGTQSGVAAMALAYARPVVASRVGSIPELVRHNENGLLVPPCDAMALAEAIEHVITDNELWERLAMGARMLRNGELSWNSIADTTIRIYNSVVEMRSGLYR
ncbi:MAG: glycosyltransferase family 4 protein [Nitrosospira sp.]